jgi:hypothetical protein
MTGTFLNRVKNNGRLEMSWVGGPFPMQGSPAQSNPSFSQFTSGVRLVGEPGQEIVRLTEFRFGTRVPIITGPVGPTNASTIAAGFPSINYEPVGSARISRCGKDRLSSRARLMSDLPEMRLSSSCRPAGPISRPSVRTPPACSLMSSPHFGWHAGGVRTGRVPALARQAQVNSAGARASLPALY